MTARVERRLAYDASADAVAAMLLDPAFREEVLAAQHVLRGSASVDGHQVRVERVHAADRIPSFAKKFVGEEIDIVQHEEWAGRSATVHVTIPGKPGEIRGTTGLADGSGGTVQTVDLSVKVGVPLIGAKVEALVADLLGKAYDKEWEVGRAWLGRGGA
jgi:hypothetical protein